MIAEGVGQRRRGTLLTRGLGAGVVAVLLSASAALAERLPGSEWSPVTLDGDPFVVEAEVFIGFESDGAYVGNGGRNDADGGPDGRSGCRMGRSGFRFAKRIKPSIERARHARAARSG